MGTKDRKVAVVGAGIGGLTLGIELRRRGVDVEIWEATHELREVGAAVALSANATRFYLERFRLERELSADAAEVDGLIHRDGRTGEVVGRHHTKESYRERFGAPYYGIHRADLQRILSGAFGRDGLHLGKRVVGVDDGADRARLRFEDGDTAEADLVIGADGARSGIRRQLLGYDDALFSGTVASRGIVSPESLDLLPDPEAIQFWMGPGAHLLHYPIGSGNRTSSWSSGCPRHGPIRAGWPRWRTARTWPVSRTGTRRSDR
ncbi:FAD-dependent monooxygenase [Kocuria sp. JC486]|uniref:FAD-dependent monooxygenase n=1 Tax=Kocuria sp. JC486 TaxID=1970736 RepID=UPI001ADDB98A